MSEPPIMEMDYTFGLNVVDIGDVRVARGKSRRPPLLKCPHLKMVYDLNERRVWCTDCETTVDNFDAFRALVEQHQKAWARIKSHMQSAKEALEHSLFSRAAKALDDYWRGRKLAPCCPHCKEALLPEDFSNGVTASRGLEMERARRNAKT